MKYPIKQHIKELIESVGYDIKFTKHIKDFDLYINHYGLESVKNKQFYNISGGGHFGFGGGFKHPCWTNVDVLRPNSKNEISDIIHDLLELKSLPIYSLSAELVYSQFTLEHITDEAARILFHEVYRILKNKGTFRIVVPNNLLDCIAYFNNDISFFYWTSIYSKPEVYRKMHYKIPLNKASFEQVFLVHFAANASIIHDDGISNPIDDKEFRAIFSKNKIEDAMNICTSRCSVEKQKLYRQNHINWWTHEKLEIMLKEAGFNKIYILGPGQSSSKVMRNRTYFDRYWNELALFVEAIK